MPTNNATNTSNPITVGQGGTGDSSLTAYAVMCGGTTSTGAVQSIAGVGTSGQILTSNGAGALPTFQAAGSVGSSLVLLQSQTASSSASLTFTTGTNTYSQMLVTFYGIQPATNGATFQMQMSSDGGSTYKNSGYLSGINVSAYSSASLTNVQSTSSFILTGGQVSGDANKTSNGHYMIMNANVGANSYVTGTSTYFDSVGSTCYFAYLGGDSGNTGANAFKFFMSSGNISAGTITLYGLKTS